MSVLGRLLLAFLLWVAVVAFVQASPYAQTAPTALFFAVSIGKLVVPIFVLWPLLALIYRSRKPTPKDAVCSGHSED